MEAAASACDSVFGAKSSAEGFCSVARHLQDGSNSSETWLVNRGLRALDVTGISTSPACTCFGLLLQVVSGWAQRHLPFLCVCVEFAAAAQEREGPGGANWWKKFRYPLRGSQGFRSRGVDTGCLALPGTNYTARREAPSLLLSSVLGQRGGFDSRPCELGRFATGGKQIGF